jgi:twitching motility two-component system response regulator PilG
VEQTTIDNPTAPVLDDEARALRLAIDHARRGNAVAARILLVDICSRNPNNELAWLWRASLATTADEGLSYMDQVLRLNPQNRTALGWLAKMGRPLPTAAGEPALTRRAPDAPVSPEQPGRSAAGTTISGTSIPGTVSNVSGTVANSGVSAAAVAETPAPLAPKPARRLVACPVCQAENEPQTNRCPSCRSILIAANALEYSLSRSIDGSLASAAIERWKPLAASGSIDAELALATVYLNILDFAQASQHLKRAVQRGLPTPPPAMLADGSLITALTYPVVMVVDDSATIRDVVVRTLSPHEILPLPAGNPWEVIDTMLAQKPALVLLDVTMPGVDGLELCRKIRSNKELRSTPVIMLTGHDALIDKLVGKMAGATEYLTKPFKQDVLLRTVRKYLEKRRG